jgi:hypothetical protein
MGKRELLIIIGFVVVGALAYQFTAPPATGNSGFSFGDIFKEVRREVRGNPGQGTFAHTATVPAPAALREVRLIGVAGTVQVVGEDRDTLTYEFTVQSNGPDDAGAVALAKETKLEHDDLGDALILRARYPDPGSQTATIVLRVPRRLAVRVESGRGITISNVATAHLEGNRGDVTLTGIAGAITGIHQDGDFTATGAASVKLRLLRSRGVITHINDGVILDVRDGDCKIADSGGAMEVDETRGEVTITGHRGRITVRGTDGRVTIQHPTAETRVDTRRAEVELVMERAVVTTVLTTDEPIRLLLVGTPNFVLDSAANVAAIQATDFGLTPEATPPDMKLAHTFGSGGARVTLRNTRGDIIVRKNPQAK